MLSSFRWKRDVFRDSKLFCIGDLFSQREVCSSSKDIQIVSLGQWEFSLLLMHYHVLVGI